MPMFPEPLIDADETAIKDALRDMDPMTLYNYTTLVAELDRRAAQRQASSNNRLAWLVGIATLINAGAAILAWSTAAGFDLWPW